MRPGSQAAQDESSASDGGTNSAAHDAGKESEFKNVLGSLEGVAAAGEASNKVAGSDSLERISRGDGERSNNGAGRGEVDEECSSENSGPDAVTEDKESGKCDASAGPHGRGAGVEKRKPEGQLSGDEVHCEQPCEKDQMFRIGLAGH